MATYDLICIGSGPAGEKAATQAAYYGYRAAVVEQAARPGGAMVNTGTVPSKALRETALLCSAFRRRPLPGMEFEIDHTVSIHRFMARRHLIQQQEHDRIESSIDRHGIDVHRGRGSLTSPNTVRIVADDGTSTEIEGQYILIATGSSPVRPDFVPFHDPRVVDADGVLDLDALPASMAIVGAGVIGCEYASVFAEIGVHVTLIDPRPHVLPFLDAECCAHLLQSMQDRGVELELERSVTSISPGERSISVAVDRGEPIEAEVLLWAAGRASNSTGIGLEDVGVELGKRGLVMVDEHYQTRVPSIYAAGDVIGFPALASTSMEQGRVAACHMFDLEFKKKLADTLPVGIYTIPGISMIGLMEDEAREAGHDTVVGTALYRDNVRGRMLGDETGILKCVFDRRTHALLGATVLGESATELIHIAQAVLVNGGGIDYFINACFNYPSLTELYKYAAYSALQQLSAGDARRVA